MRQLEELAAWLDEALAAAEPVPDIDQRVRGLSPSDAYRVQHLLMQRKVARGDRVVGYKAALTSKSMQEQIGIAQPMLGTLLASRVLPRGRPVSLSGNGFMRPTLEPEIAVLLKHELTGPGVTALDALAATDGYLAAVELGDYRIDGPMRSLQAGAVCNTFNGGVILGGAVSDRCGIDPRLEGMTMSHNGSPAGSGTGVEVLGDPIESVVFMANTLAELGLGLAAGMILMTGSITASIELAAGDHVRVEFTRLGGVEVRIEQ